GSSGSSCRKRCAWGSGRCASRSRRSPSRLEELDRVAGRIVEEDLGAARAGDDLGGAEAHAGGTEPFDLRLEVGDLDVEAIPAARLLLAAVGERALAGAAVSAQQEPHAVARQRGEGGRGVEEQAES